MILLHGSDDGDGDVCDGGDHSNADDGDVDDDDDEEEELMVQTS